MRYYLWSQHLNNISPDIIADVSTNYEDVREKEARSNIITLISRITSQGKALTKKRSYSIVYAYRNVFVFDVETDDRDSGGRKSNITGYYEGPELSDRNSMNSLIDKIRDFASRNKRVISEDALNDLVECLNQAQEEKKSLKTRKVVVVAGLTLLALITLILLFQNYRGK